MKECTMPRLIRMMILLLVSVGSRPAAVTAASPEQPPRVPVLSDAECWKQLPPTEGGGSQPLPSWARALAGAIPRSTAALLRTEFVHRARNPIHPALRARMRWIAAHANRCAYSE